MRSSLGAVGFALSLLTLSLLAAACGGSSEQQTLSGFERTPTPVVNEARLPEATNDGEPFAFEAEGDDELLLVYFGFTNCPDVCPTTLADLRLALDAMQQDERGMIDVAMITVDPNRDTDEVLTGYVRSFVPDAAAVRTAVDSDLRVVAEAFGADYEVTTDDEGRFEVIHTGSLYAVNSAGELLVSWPFGVPPEDITKDLRILLERQAA
ncbi:MAG: SCO family protein [Acidimicrobiales bacterium]